MKELRQTESYAQEKTTLYKKTRDMEALGVFRQNAGNIYRRCSAAGESIGQSIGAIDIMRPIL